MLLQFSMTCVNGLNIFYFKLEVWEQISEWIYYCCPNYQGGNFLPKRFITLTWAASQRVGFEQNLKHAFLQNYKNLGTSDIHSNPPHIQN